MTLVALICAVALISDVKESFGSVGALIGGALLLAAGLGFDLMVSRRNSK